MIMISEAKVIYFKLWPHLLHSLASEKCILADSCDKSGTTGQGLGRTWVRLGYSRGKAV